MDILIKEFNCAVNVIEPVNNVVAQGSQAVHNVILVELYFKKNAHAILLLTMMG